MSWDVLILDVGKAGPTSLEEMDKDFKPAALGPADEMIDPAAPQNTKSADFQAFRDRAFSHR